MSSSVPRPSAWELIWTNPVRLRYKTGGQLLCTQRHKDFPSPSRPPPSSYPCTYVVVSTDHISTTASSQAFPSVAKSMAVQSRQYRDHLRTLDINPIMHNAATATGRFGLDAIEAKPYVPRTTALDQQAMLGGSNVINGSKYVPRRNDESIVRDDNEDDEDDDDEHDKRDRKRPQPLAAMDDHFPYLRDERRRTRKLLSPGQTRVLEAVLERTIYPSTPLREAVARQLGIAPRKVQIWFQNKRQGRRRQACGVNGQPDGSPVSPSEQDASFGYPPAGFAHPSSQQPAPTSHDRCIEMQSAADDMRLAELRDDLGRQFAELRLSASYLDVGGSLHPAPHFDQFTPHYEQASDAIHHHIAMSDPRVPISPMHAVPQVHPLTWSQVPRSAQFGASLPPGYDPYGRSEGPLHEAWNGDSHKSSLTRLPAPPRPTSTIEGSRYLAGAQASHRQPAAQATVVEQPVRQVYTSYVIQPCPDRHPVALHPSQQHVSMRRFRSAQGLQPVDTRSKLYAEHAAVLGPPLASPSSPMSERGAMRPSPLRNGRQSPSLSTRSATPRTDPRFCLPIRSTATRSPFRFRIDSTNENLHASHQPPPAKRIRHVVVGGEGGGTTAPYQSASLQTRDDRDHPRAYDSTQDASPSQANFVLPSFSMPRVASHRLELAPQRSFSSPMTMSSPHSKSSMSALHAQSPSDRYQARSVSDQHQGRQTAVERPSLQLPPLLCSSDVPRTPSPTPSSMYEANEAKASRSDTSPTKGRQALPSIAELVRG